MRRKEQGGGKDEQAAGEAVPLRVQRRRVVGVLGESLHLVPVTFDIATNLVHKELMLPRTG